ncbi:MAG TPA: M20/M25/M40 family metallo-hydrolase [Clostridia bacterium]|nr:M20/M25/M40 family metallo-hydrolase [Clostridia bacterium]
MSIKPTKAGRRASGRSGADNAKALRREILSITRSPGFADYLRGLLIELCRVDTTPSPEIARMRAAEDACFKILERELGTLEFPDKRLERLPINPAIQEHENFSLLHFTKTARRPKGLPAEQTYKGRTNLVCVLPGSGGEGGLSLALNAHIDVVAPYFAPSVKGGTIFGRGSCDDKGPVVGIVGALKVLSQALARTGIQLNRNVTGMFVVEEETGGNGSLSLAIDRKLKGLYESIMVCECTGLKVHPANRGAVWYKAVIAAPKGISAFELFAFVNEEMEKEGAAIRTESHHPLFPQRPVQTCHGMIGLFGEHPSRICGEVVFRMDFPQKPDERVRRLLEDCLQSGLASYVGMYGDKTAVIDPSTGKPMVKAHYDLSDRGNSVVVRVHGATGHMGAIRERDGAITKMAHLVRSLVRSRGRLESIGGGKVRIQLEGASVPASLVLEGGQGFVPTHTIREVMDRLRRAAERGAENYLRRVGSRVEGRKVITVTYEKLHNVAFDGDAASPSMKNALTAAKMSRLPAQEPVLGWTVSCDARLFATEYPDMPVLTFGPGLLAHAHSDREQVELEDIRAAAEFLAQFILLQTGTSR